MLENEGQRERMRAKEGLALAMFHMMSRTASFPLTIFESKCWARRNIALTKWDYF